MQRRNYLCMTDSTSSCQSSELFTTAVGSPGHQGIWHTLQWFSPSPGTSPRHFALFIAYGWTPRVGSRDACVALYGVALQAYS